MGAGFSTHLAYGRLEDQVGIMRDNFRDVAESHPDLPNAVAFDALPSYASTSGGDVGGAPGAAFLRKPHQMLIRWETHFLSPRE